MILPFLMAVTASAAWGLYVGDLSYRKGWGLGKLAIVTGIGALCLVVVFNLAWSRP